jgi:uncharacterized protein YdcH (DUF465 family)
MKLLAESIDKLINKTETYSKVKTEDEKLDQKIAAAQKNIQNLDNEKYKQLQKLTEAYKDLKDSKN